MAKRKVGLHKEVTAIFDGVPVADRDAAANAGAAHQKGPAGPPRQRVRQPVPPVPKAPSQQPQAPSARRGPVGKSTAPEEPKVPIDLGPTGPGFLQQLKEKFLAPKEGVSEGRQKVMVLLVPVLLVALIVVYMRVLSPSGSSSPPRQVTPSGATSELKTDFEWTMPQPYPADLRDPMVFKPVKTVEPAPNNATTPEQPPEIRIDGIVWSNTKPLAIIGKKIISEGQTISGAKVVKINKDSVEFEKDGKTWTLPVK